MTDLIALADSQDCTGAIQGVIIGADNPEACGVCIGCVTRAELRNAHQRIEELEAALKETSEALAQQVEYTEKLERVREAAEPYAVAYNSLWQALAEVKSPDPGTTPEHQSTGTPCSRPGNPDDPG